MIDRVQSQIDPQVHWQRGLQCERDADLAGAEACYLVLVASSRHHVPALLRLSRFAQMRDDYRASRDYALRAADACRLAGSTRHLAHVTQRLLDFAEDGEVASVVLSCDWHDPHVLQQAAPLAQHLWLAGRIDDARRFLDTLQPRIAATAPLALTRGHVAQFLGDLDQAAHHYEHALRLDPHLADAHWSIAKLQRDTDPRRITRLRIVIDAASSRPLDRAQLHYALFHELDRQDDVDAAWDALSEGARGMVRLVADAPRPPAFSIDSALADAWPAGTIAAPPHSQPAPVFILGLPRSGTTLLDRMLGNHGWVTCAGERNDLRAALDEASGHFASASRFLAGHADPALVGHLYRQRLRRSASATAFATDKNPQNLYRIPTILAALPEAKIICVQRAPMDLAFSNLKELFHGGAYAYSYAFAELATEVQRARHWMQHWAEAAPHAVRLVDYETLVMEPQRVMREVCSFIGLPDQAGLADIERNTMPVSTASSVQVRSAVHRDALGAWQRYACHLEPLQRLLAEST